MWMEPVWRGVLTRMRWNLLAKQCFTRSPLRQPCPDNPDLVVKLILSAQSFVSLCVQNCSSWVVQWISLPPVPSGQKSETKHWSMIPGALDLVALMKLGTSAHPNNHLREHTRGYFSFKSRPLSCNRLKLLGHFNFSIFPGDCTIVHLSKSFCWR